MSGLRKSILALGLVLIYASTLPGQELPVDRCTAGSPRREGKVGKFRVLVDNSNPPGECRLTVSRGNKELFATQAKIIDVLAIWQDLNLDTKPDLAFQTGPTGECCWTLHVLSLEKSPKVIGEIQNRFPFLRSPEPDKGVPEFWAQDGGLADGFDGLRANEIAELPTLVIQWDGAKPLDVSSHYLKKYDDVAAKLESQLTPDLIAGFRQSDGKLDGSGPQMEHLRRTKALALEIVWMFLYTGRDEQAWEKLGKLWPEQDAPRIRKLLTETLQTGLRGQLSLPPVFVSKDCLATTDGSFDKVGGKVTAPRAKYSPEPGYSEQAKAASFQGTVVLWAIISQDGCISQIRVSRFLGRGLDEKAIEAVRQWKFEPARKNGVPVAVQINIEVNFRLY